MRRLTALFLVAAAMFIAFACSQKQVDDTSDSGVDNGADAAADSPLLVPTDGPPSVLDGTGSSLSCPGTVPEGSLPLWAAPKSGTIGACSDAQIAAIVSNVSQGLSGVYTSLNNSTACQACVFSIESDPNWQVIVFDDVSMDTGFLNFGACYALATGGTAACGKALETEKLCEIAACPGDSCNNVEECFASADESVCGAESNQTATACGAQLNSLTAACDNLTDVLHIVCGGASDGGGSDGGADATAD